MVISATTCKINNCENKITPFVDVCAKCLAENQGGIIRGDYQPVSDAEAKFKELCDKKGWRAHRPSWPDYIVETKTGNLLCVEVKGSDKISMEQFITFSLLEKYGFNLFVWKNKNGVRDRLFRWSFGKAIEKWKMRIKNETGETKRLGMPKKTKEERRRIRSSNLFSEPRSNRPLTSNHKRG